MVQIAIKRVYEEPSIDDGYRVLVDRLWPRGIKKENLKCDEWAKYISPSPSLRIWFHGNKDLNWEEFATLYRAELRESDAVKAFADKVKDYEKVTLVYASKDPIQNHARVLQECLTELL